jgi:hypothetical protein
MKHEFHATVGQNSFAWSVAEGAVAFERPDTLHKRSERRMDRVVTHAKRVRRHVHLIAVGEWRGKSKPRRR